MAGHISRMSDTRLPKIVFYGQLEQGLGVDPAKDQGSGPSQKLNCGGPQRKNMKKNHSNHYFCGLDFILMLVIRFSVKNTFV